MKKVYEAPEANIMLFVAQQDLAFSFDHLEDLTNPVQKPGNATVISDGDILVPLL